MPDWVIYSGSGIADSHHSNAVYYMESFLAWRGKVMV